MTEYLSGGRVDGVVPPSATSLPTQEAVRIPFKFHGVGVSGFFSRDIACFRAVVYPMYPETRKIQGHRVHL